MSTASILAYQCIAFITHHYHRWTGAFINHEYVVVPDAQTVRYQTQTIIELRSVPQRQESPPRCLHNAVGDMKA